MNTTVSPLTLRNSTARMHYLNWPGETWDSFTLGDGEQHSDWLLVFVRRALMQGLDLIDTGAFDMSDWEQQLPPPAAKTAVQTLTVVIISPEQAGEVLSKLNSMDVFLTKCKW